MKAALKKRLYQAVGFALLLSIVLSFGFFALADDDAKMSWHYPQEGDDMIYQWEFEKQVTEVDFDGIAMYLRFNVKDEGKQHLVRANWMPDIPVAELDGVFVYNTSFYDYLADESEYMKESDIYGKDVDLLIEQSGLSETEAKEEWFTSIQVQTAHTFPFKIEVLDNYQLYGRDLILGAYGAEAAKVEEGELNGRKMLKATIDYTHIYDDIQFSEEDWEIVLMSIIKNYIFLFDDEGEYMVCVSGTMDMDVLEKIAENLDIYETELVRKKYNTGADYILHDMAKG